MLGLVKSLHQPRLSANKAESSPFLCDRSSLGPFFCHCSVLRVSAPTFFFFKHLELIFWSICMCMCACLISLYACVCEGRGGQRRIICVWLWQSRDLKTFYTGSLTESGATLSAECCSRPPVSDQHNCCVCRLPCMSVRDSSLVLMLA